MEYYFTYVLRSLKTGKLYYGHTENLARRIREHNSGKTKSIKAFIPYALVYYEVFTNRQEAIDRERYFKSAAGRRFLKKKIQR